MARTTTCKIMDIRKHQNILAVLYFAAGYFFAFTLLFTTTEIHLKACGCLCTIYYTWLLAEQL